MGRGRGYKGGGMKMGDREKEGNTKKGGSVRRQLITAFPRFPSIVDTESRVIVI